jgi:hypothetical protein
MSGRFWCKGCAYGTTRANDWRKHVVTRKHMAACARGTQPFACDGCAKTYSTRSGLWKHGKSCATASAGPPPAGGDAELMQTLIAELRAHEVRAPASRIAESVTINVFLRDRCGQAMDFKAFVRGMSVSLDDIAITRAAGFIRGTSRILLDRLAGLDALERPIHCVDKKRLSFFVRDQNAWCRDDGERMTRAIGEVAQKQLARVKEWEEHHPRWHEVESDMVEYLSLVREVSGGASAEEQARNHREIAKAVGEQLCIKDAMAVALTQGS